MLTFLNPAFLWALGAAAIPLILHLLQRRRKVQLPFPTIRFLKMAQRRSSSRIRLENFLLWLLRTLLLMALALAFAMPVLKKTVSADWLMKSRRDVVIIVDASYSMSYETERGNVLEAAKEAAVSIVEALSDGDRACVYVAAHEPIPLIERPTSDKATILQAIRSIEWRPESSSLDATVALALFTLDQRKEPGREREVFVLTDGQALPWKGFQTLSDAEEGIPTAISRENRDKVTLFAMTAGALSPENTWISSVSVSPPLLLDGQTAKLDVKLGRTGQTRNVSVTAFVDNDAMASHAVTVEPNALSSVELALPSLRAGVYTVKVRVTVDALSCDDEMLLLLNVRKQLPVLIAGPPHATKFLSAALAPGGASDVVKTILMNALAAEDLTQYEAVFIADAFPLEGQAILQLETFVRAGGVLGVFPGHRAGAQSYDTMPTLPARVIDKRSVASTNASRVIGIIRQEDGIFSNFRIPRGVIPTVALKQVLTFEEPTEGGAVVLTAGEDQPLMLARTVGRGKIFQFAVSAERDWSTLPLTAFFVPIVHGVLRHGAGAAQTPPYVFLNSELSLISTISGHRDSDRILSRSGKEVSVRDAGNQRYVIEALTEVGFYRRMRSGAEPESVIAANAVRDESSLDMATPDEITEWSDFKTVRVVRTPEDLMNVAEGLRTGRMLAEPLLWLAAVLAFLEWWVANRTLRKRPKISDSLTIDLSGKVSGIT